MKRIAASFFLLFVGNCLVFSNNILAFSNRPSADDMSKVNSSSDLLPKIKEAQKRLRAESVEILKDTVGTRRVRVGRRKYKTVPVIGIVGREMALAVLDSEGKIRIARGIKRDRGFEVQTPGFLFSVRRDNGINSNFACLKPANGKVLAVKYPISNEGNRFGPGDSVIESVYTPYSPEIRTREVIERGIEVQHGFIDEAYARLRERAVFSRAYPGRKIVDVVPKDVLTVLLINEHIDPGAFESEGMAKPLAEEVLTIIGTNLEKAYAFSISPAGARGLVQMIPSTYYLIAKKYPEARISTNFASGMMDVVNAVVAQILLCDSDWQAIRARQDINGKRIGPYLAAAYNGGVGRVLSYLEHGKNNWIEEPDLDKLPTKTVTKKVPVKVRSRGRVRTKYVTRSYSQPIFRFETSKYVQQYHWIYDYFVSSKSKGFKGK